MEFKTCEQYVLSELEDTKNSLDLVEDAYRGALKQYLEVKGKYEELCQIIRDIATVNTYSDNHCYISFSSLWEGWDDDRFSRMVELVDQLKVESH